MPDNICYETGVKFDHKPTQSPLHPSFDGRSRSTDAQPPEKFIHNLSELIDTNQSRYGKQIPYSRPPQSPHVNRQIQTHILILVYLPVQ